MEASGCGFGAVWVLSDVKGGNGLDSLSFSSRLRSLVYGINRKKRRSGETNALCSALFSIQFFSTDCVSYR